MFGDTVPLNFDKLKMSSKSVIDLKLSNQIDLLKLQPFSLVTNWCSYFNSWWSIITIVLLICSPWFLSSISFYIFNYKLRRKIKCKCWFSPSDPCVLFGPFFLSLPLFVTAIYFSAPGMSMASSKASTPPLLASSLVSIQSLYSIYGDKRLE